MSKGLMVWAAILVVTALSLVACQDKEVAAMKQRLDQQQAEIERLRAATPASTAAAATANPTVVPTPEPTPAPSPPPPVAAAPAPAPIVVTVIATAPPPAPATSALTVVGRRRWTPVPGSVMGWDVIAYYCVTYAVANVGTEKCVTAEDYDNLNQQQMNAVNPTPEERGSYALMRLCYNQSVPGQPLPACWPR